MITEHLPRARHPAESASRRTHWPPVLCCPAAAAEVPRCRTSDPWVPRPGIPPGRGRRIRFRQGCVLVTRPGQETPSRRFQCAGFPMRCRGLAGARCSAQVSWAAGRSRWGGRWGASRCCIQMMSSRMGCRHGRRRGDGAGASCWRDTASCSLACRRWGTWRRGAGQEMGSTSAILGSMPARCPIVPLAALRLLRHWHRGQAPRQWRVQPPRWCPCGGSGDASRSCDE